MQMLHEPRHPVAAIELPNGLAVKIPRQRADIIMQNQGLADSPAKAAALIMAGCVYAGTRRIEKAAQLLPADTGLRLKDKEHDFVSRGALKLQAALDYFDINASGKLCLDVGASTGGFTELLLQRGAEHVYAVDVGTNQLDWKLRSDSRVTSLERCDARTLTPQLIPQAPQLITADVSFISLKLALPAALRLAASSATAILLIKPQFELPPHQVPAGGVVTDLAAQQATCRTVQIWLQEVMEWHIMGIIPSPITGRDGNQEYLIAAHNQRA